VSHAKTAPIIFVDENRDCLAKTSAAGGSAIDNAMSLQITAVMAAAHAAAPTRTATVSAHARRRNSPVSISRIN
jgi:hypothetical protein